MNVYLGIVLPLSIAALAILGIVYIARNQTQDVWRSASSLDDSLMTPLSNVTLPYTAMSFYRGERVTLFADKVHLDFLILGFIPKDGPIIFYRDIRVIRIDKVPTQYGTAHHLVISSMNSEKPEKNRDGAITTDVRFFRLEERRLIVSFIAQHSPQATINKLAVDCCEGRL